MLSVAVISDPEVAEASLDPVRGRILAALIKPGSATTLAEVLGLSRQKVNYHLRTLESHGLVDLVEERRKGNMTERVMQASAAAYVISPEAMSSVPPDPDRSPDRLSAQWLVALCSRAVSEVGELVQRSQRATQQLATFGLDVEIAFASAADRASFVAELSSAIEGMVSKYHNASSPKSRSHRLVLGLHPKITKLDPPTELVPVSQTNS